MKEKGSGIREQGSGRKELFAQGDEERRCEVNEFYISKSQLWCEAIETAEVLLKTRLVNLERGKEKLTPGERKAVTAMKRKLTSFIKYGEAAHSSWRMNAG